MNQWPTNVRACVYRLYGADGVLLYVGCTYDLRRRLKEHSDRKSWFSDVRRVEEEWVSGRAAALALEREAIRLERPRYNAIHTGRRWEVCPQSDAELAVTEVSPQDVALAVEAIDAVLRDIA